MTPVALTYFLLGLSALLWPVALLLLRRYVLDAQWMIAAAMALLGTSLILYSTLFNHFLNAEYILVVLYMVTALATPPTTLLAVHALTRTEGLGRMIRLVFIPTLLTALALALSVAAGGADMYRAWIDSGVRGQSHIFFEGRLRYNIIVFVHFYLFSVILALQTLAMALYTALQFRRYLRILREYLPSDRHRTLVSHSYLISILLLAILFSASLILFPLNTPRMLLPVILLAIPQALAIALLGFNTYNLHHGAEILGRRISQTSTSPRLRRDPVSLDRAIALHLQQGAYLDPHLSVFTLAEHFHVSQDQIVDSVHRLHGAPFADFVDSHRIDHLLHLLDTHSAPPDATGYQLTLLAHQCGFPDAQSLLSAWRHIMRTPFPGSDDFPE